MINLPKLTGVVASKGIAFGKAYILSSPDLTFERRIIKHPHKEMERLNRAILKAEKEIKKIRLQVAQEQGEEHATIFDAHLLMLKDDDYIRTVEQKIVTKALNAESALVEVTDVLTSTFKQLNNLYIRERITDIRDVVDRVLAHLLDIPLPNIRLIDEQTIIVADELKPSETIAMNQMFVKGFVTENGSKTSHATIIARSLNISALVGVEQATKIIEHNDELIIDAIAGKVIINPDNQVKKQYLQKLNQLNDSQIQLTPYKYKETKTKDGRKLHLAANISSFKDVDVAKENNVDGVGLVRTEFLFMDDRSMLTEERQFLTYKNILQKMKNKPVVARTLDIGGDKQLVHTNMYKEDNPLLGLRSIRFALKNKKLFQTQLRALLRASVYGKLKIMFPMITTIEELIEAKKLLEKEKLKLQQEKIPVSENIPIGMMIETPSSALLSDLLIQEVDFLSVGTNDLIQYTFAIDRTNEHVAHLYEPLHPAILRLIKQVIDVGRNNNKIVKVCGELSQDEQALPLLIGLGLETFSMNPAAILRIRKQISRLTVDACKTVAKQALVMNSAKDVKQLLRRQKLIKI